MEEGYDNIYTLYIIGNGFDQHHDIQSSYQQYIEWVKKYRKRLYARFTMFYADTTDEHWKSFEENIPNITLVNYIRYILGLSIEDISQKIENEFSHEWKDKEMNLKDNLLFDIAHLMNCEISKMYEDISQTFRDWLNELSIEVQEEKLIFLETENTYYLTFNYTSTLENVYQIPLTKIKHIHNAKFRWEELIFGHNRNCQYLEEHLRNEEDKLYDIREKLICNYSRTELLKILYSKKKDVEGIIKNITLWNRLHSVKQINILGFSFSSVDEKYIDKVRESVSNDVEWRISYYTEKDRDVILHYFRKSGIKESKILLVRISDLLRVYWC